MAVRPDTVKVRVCQGADGRDVLQMRLDMGILQLGDATAARTARSRTATRATSTT